MTSVFQGLSLARSVGRVGENPGNEAVPRVRTHHSQVPKRSKHRKTSRIKQKEPKKTDSRLFFALNGVLDKMGNVSLKRP